MNKIIDTLDFLKFKKISSVKINVRRIRRLSIDWETTFAKDTSDQGWLSKIYTHKKKHLKFNHKKSNNLGKKNGTKILKDTPSKEIWQVSI